VVFVGARQLLARPQPGISTRRARSSVAPDPAACRCRAPPSSRPASCKGWSSFLQNAASLR
jgi:hypothetical protein